MVKYLDDLFYLAGWGLIIFATSQISYIAALYVAGIGCMITAVLIGLIKSGLKLKAPEKATKNDH